MTRAGGGGGSFGTTGSAGGSGGGGQGGSIFSGTTKTSGSVNTGSGGGGGRLVGLANGAGGSGVVILRYPNVYTISNPGGGLTLSTATDGNFKVTTVTAGTGNVQFAV